ARHCASVRAPSPSAYACSTLTWAKGTISTVVVMMTARGWPRPSRTLRAHSRSCRFRQLSLEARDQRPEPSLESGCRRSGFVELGVECSPDLSQPLARGGLGDQIARGDDVESGAEDVGLDRTHHRHGGVFGPAASAQ